VRILLNEGLVGLCVGVGEGRRRALAFLFEGEFTLLVVVFVLSSTTILASLLLSALAVVREVERDCGDGVGAYLSLVLRHIGGFFWLCLLCVTGF
jgi:hypothetical protein